MPLSEHELRTLEQLEAQLSADDPKFAQAMQHDPLQRRRRQRAALVAGIVLAGLGLVIAAALLKQTWVGLVGALVIAVGALMSLQVPRRRLVVVEEHDSGSDLAGQYGTITRATLHDMTADRPAGSASSASSVTALYRQGRPVRARRGTSPFMARMEERWERRRRENQGW